jgi:hypothetical protein
MAMVPATASNKAALYPGCLEVESVGVVELLLAGRGSQERRQLDDCFPTRRMESDVVAPLACLFFESKTALY